MALSITSRRISQLSHLFSGFSKMLNQTYLRQFSQQADDSTKIAFYDEIKDLPNHKEKLLIDVREKEELIETGVIPTSINIPLKAVFENLKLPDHEFVDKFNRSKSSPQTDLIIFTCRSGKRAGEACEMANQLGFKNVKNYKGSWIDWAKHEGK